MSIFPYAYRMIETFNITKDTTQISIYAGMLITSFAFAEFSTGMIWGRISDRLGRKPVLILGLIGTALSMVSFGFARSLPAAIIARALGGLLNGNVGVLQTTVAELVTVKEHQPRAYSIMPFVWCLGSIIGPAMGGALAMPCESYPWLFPRGSIFDKFPFLLPNLVCVGILMLGILIGILFLEETHSDLKSRRDWGNEIARRTIHRITGSRETIEGEKLPSYQSNENEYSNDNDSPPSYRSTESSPRTSTSLPASRLQDPDPEAGGFRKEDRSTTKTFNKQVILIIVGYGILAYHSVSFDSLMPTFLSEPVMDTKPSLPFHFAGGFALSTKTIGFMMAVQGVYSMIAQLWFFPFIIRRMGTLSTFRLVMVIWPILYMAVPYLILLPQKLQTTGIYFALLAKITFHVIAFPSNAILLTNAAPSNKVLGTINGVAASTACLARAFGPTVTGAIHSAGLKFGFSGPAWWFGGLVCAIGAIESFYMEEVEGRMDRPSTEEEQATCEPLLHNTNLEATDEAVASRGSVDSITGFDLSIMKA